MKTAHGAVSGGRHFRNTTPSIDFAAIPSPIILRGNAEQAYRDPCGHYYDGVFRVWHTNIRGPADSGWSAATAVTESHALQEVHGNASLGIAWSDDLVHWDWPHGSGDA